MGTALKRIRDTVNKRINEKEYIQKEINNLKDKKLNLKREIIKKEKALVLVKDVAINTQQQLEYHLNDMVSAGLNTVFEDAYEFVVKFELRRGKTECDLFFKKGEELVDPLRFSGLGAADVAAFTLRCASWCMDKRYRNVLILDEPFSHLKGEVANTKALKLMQTLSSKLNLQIICINDERAPLESIIEYADKVFKIKLNKKGVSKVQQLN